MEILSAPLANARLTVRPLMRYECAPMPAPRRAAFAFIFVTVLLDIFALGLAIPVFPRLIERFVGNTADAARVFGLFGTLWAAMQFVFSPILGMLSDRFGRRPVVLISNFGLAADYVLIALAPDLAWLTIGRILSGITAASISTAGAYIADVTPPDQRAGRFGMLGAAFGIGFVLGPAVGGLLAGVGPRAPFWVAASLSLLNGLYGLFVLPESLPPERRAPFVWAKANALGALRFLGRQRELFGFASVHFLNQLSHQVLQTTFVLYAGYRYGWTERGVGLALGAVGVGSIVVQAGLVRPVIRAIGEFRALVLGLLCGALGFTIYGLAPTGGWFMSGIPAMALWGFSGAAAQGLMTRRVGGSEQGQLQGALTGLQGIAGLIGPTLFTSIFAMSIRPGTQLQAPGASFFVAAALLVVAAVLATAVRAKTTATVPNSAPPPAQ